MNMRIMKIGTLGEKTCWFQIGQSTGSQSNSWLWTFKRWGRGRGSALRLWWIPSPVLEKRRVVSKIFTSLKGITQWCTVMYIRVFKIVPPSSGWWHKLVNTTMGYSTSALNMKIKNSKSLCCCLIYLASTVLANLLLKHSNWKWEILFLSGTLANPKYPTCSWSFGIDWEWWWS